jgi:hypothetical protein
MSTNKKTDPPVLPDSPEQFIDAAGWQFAKMMRPPHEYTLRGKPTAGVEPPPVEWFDWFRSYIRQHGYRAKFGEHSYTYLEPGDGWKYWPVANVINRAKLPARRGPKPRAGLTARQRRSLDAAARQVERAERRASEARAALVERIVAIHAGGAGATVREIADAVALSHARVGELVLRSRSRD